MATVAAPNDDGFVNVRFTEVVHYSDKISKAAVVLRIPDAWWPKDSRSNTLVFCKSLVKEADGSCFRRELFEEEHAAFLKLLTTPPDDGMDHAIAFLLRTRRAQLAAKMDGLSEEKRAKFRPETAAQELELKKKAETLALALQEYEPEEYAKIAAPEKKRVPFTVSPKGAKEALAGQPVVYEVVLSVSVHM